MIELTRFDAAIPWTFEACMIYMQLRQLRLAKHNEWGRVKTFWRSLAKASQVQGTEAAKDAVEELRQLGLVYVIQEGDRVLYASLAHPHHWPVEHWQQVRDRQTELKRRTEAIAALYQAA